MKELILIADASRKYAQITARRIRERDVYCEVVALEKLLESIEAEKPVGIVLTGSEEHTGSFSGEMKSKLLSYDIPILAIGAAAAAYESAVYPFRISSANPSLLGEAAMDEVADFLFELCGCTGNYTAVDFVNDKVKELQEEIGDKKVICGLSGGIDSTVSAVLIHQAIGKNLKNILVDTGLMRKNECKKVMAVLSNSFEMDVVLVEAQDRFLEALKGVTDPEQKRKIIGSLYIDIFREEADKIGDIDYLAQGTIYSDVLESGVDGAGSVKSHHNVGGLPAHVPFKLVEPVRFLFKDEVRRVGAALGLPESFVRRQSFPGPGLGIRCLGELTKERLDILRECDAIVTEELEKTDLPLLRMQYFAILPNLRSVGVIDGNRTYLETVAIRAIYSLDMVTADYVRIPYDVLDIITGRITSTVPQINRVVLDISPKPPSAIEWE